MKSQINITDLLLRAFAPALFALTSAFIGGGGDAAADLNTLAQYRDADNNLVYHCPQARARTTPHPMAASRCPSGQAIVLDRTPHGSVSGGCGSCENITRLNLNSIYGGSRDNNQRNFIFNGKVFYNADNTNDNNDRTNSEFCQAWFGASYNSTNRTCSCPANQFPFGNHGRCRLPRSDAECTSAYSSLRYYDANAASRCVVRPHQSCYDADSANPIAVTSFSGTPATGNCRSAQNNAADIAACESIDPDTDDPSLSSGHFGAVLNGYCASNASCSGGTPFIVLPELGRETVGACVTASDCRTVYSGVPENNQCRAPMNNADCMNIDSTRPFFANGECVDVPQDVMNCPNNSIVGSARNTDPHTLACDREGFILTDHQVTDANFNICGQCETVTGGHASCADAFGTHGSDTPATAWVAYTFDGKDFCGPVGQCAATGGVREGNLNCFETDCAEGYVNTGTGGNLNCIPPAANHQVCYDADFSMPIANSTTSGDCRAAVPADAEVGGACRLIDPDTGDNAFTAGNFQEVIDGRCAFPIGGFTNSCQDQAELGFRLLPDLLGHARRAQVGRCENAAVCASTFGGYPDPSMDNTCRLPANAQECPADRPAFESGECVAITGLHHQACYDADFRMPIATALFDLNANPIPPGSCRAAMDNDADRAACALIDPRGTDLVGDFDEVLRGACSLNEPLDCQVPGEPVRFALAPDIFGEMETDDYNVGNCVVSETCAAEFGGYAEQIQDTETCRRPRQASECPADRPLFENDECVINPHQTCYDMDFRTPIADSAVAGGCRAAADTAEDRAACETIEPDGSGPTSMPGRYTGVLGGACAVVPSGACSGNGGRYHPDLFFDRSAGDDSVGIQDVGLCAVGTGCEGGITSRGILPGIVENNICRAFMESDCGQFGEFTASGRGGTCAPRVAGDCPDNQEFRDAPDPADGGTCVQCGGHQTSTNGAACEECDPNEFRGTGASCVECPIENEVRPQGEMMCSCPDATHYGDDTASTCVERLTCPGNQRYNRSDNTCIDCAENEIQSDSDEGSCVACQPTQVRTGSETECSACPHFANTEMGTCDPIADCVAPLTANDQNMCHCPPDTHETVGGACVLQCDPDETRVAAGTCEETVELSSCAPYEELEDNACVECEQNEFRGTDTSCAACPIANETRASGEAECSCNRVTHYPNATDGTCDDFATCGEGESRNSQTNECISIASCMPPNRIQADNDCERDAVCDGENQVRVVATNTCDCMDRFTDLDSTDPLNCIPECVSPAVRQADDSCAENIDCDDPNQERNPDTNTCRCERGYADSDTATPELTCTLTPECDGDNQELDMTRNVCACEEGFTDRDAAPETLNCEMIPVCDTATEVLDQTANACISRASCVLPDRFQEDGACEPDIVCAETGQGRNAANNECEVCGNARKLFDGDCVALTAADCLPAERFEGSACVLPEPGEWPTGATAPPYGEYEHGDCTGARWPWSIVQTADGLSELCHAPVNLLATEVPSSQTLNNAGGRLDFCVLRGAESGDSVRCDDPTVFGDLGIPDAPAGLVTQTTATITITLSDGATREAATVTAAVTGYLQVVHSGGSVVAVFSPDTTEAQITTATPLVGTISLEAPALTMSMTPPLGTNTITSPPVTNTVTNPPAAGGGDSGGGGGGGGAAAALIAVPVVLLGGYWLLGGFEYIDPTYNLTYSGENENLNYRGNAGFSLNHEYLSSYAEAVQSNNQFIYQSGISFNHDNFALTYDATESSADYNYDLIAQINYTHSNWTFAPTAETQFGYRGEEWTSDASAGLSAIWTAHRWNVRARSDFAGDIEHNLDIEIKF